MYIVYCIAYTVYDIVIPVYTDAMVLLLYILLLFFSFLQI